jgi:hypothetical protein
MNTNKLLKAAGCEMKVVCGKKWSELNTTEQDGIRFCEDCKKLVFYTKTVSELKVAAAKKFCAYIVPDTSAEQLDNLNEFTKKFLLVRERIRQIKPRALRQMNKPLLGHAISRQDPDFQ